jgi:hypothetical protein
LNFHKDSLASANFGFTKIQPAKIYITSTFSRDASVTLFFSSFDVSKILEISYRKR